MHHVERGAVLVEVLVAVAILSLAGVALIELVGVGASSTRTAVIREAELADQERLLAAWSLLSGVDLDRRIGRREVGPYFVDVQRPERGLYRIAIGRVTASSAEDLVTVVWRGTRGPADEP